MIEILLGQLDVMNAIFLDFVTGEQTTDEILIDRLSLDILEMEALIETEKSFERQLHAKVA